jgi:hypothetical protein
MDKELIKEQRRAERAQAIAYARLVQAKSKEAQKNQAITAPLSDTPQRGRLRHFDSQKLIWVETDGWFMLDQASGFVTFRKTNGRYWRIINVISNVDNFCPNNKARSKDTK